MSQKIFGILFITCIGLGSASMFLFERAVRSAEHEKIKTYSLYAQGMSERIAAQFYERYGDVQAFALNDVLHNGKPAEITEAFNHFAALYDIYDLILFVDKKGKYIASNNKSPTNDDLNIEHLSKMDFSDTPWFKAAINGTFTEDKAKGFSGTFFEDAQIDKIASIPYGKDMYGTGFTTIVKSSSGNILGIITARAGFRWVEYDFVSLYKQLQKEDLASTELTLVDKNGIVLVDYNPSKNGGSTEVKRNFQDTVLKANLAQLGQTGIKEVLEKQAGSTIADNVRTNESQVLGYSPVTSQKFIESIGWGVMVGSQTKEVMSELTTSRIEFYISMISLVVLSCLIALAFSNRLSRSLTNLAEKVSNHSVQVANTSFTIASASNQLSEATHEQAAALQETVAAIEEISNMVNKNAEVAHRSTEVSNTSEKAANLGKKTVDSMIIAINDISNSNAKIMDEMEVSNQEISNIVKVISEIGNKTKVINDIVFQTKLLSFNASVEAARAGEHGKGFAVVAEEVGNLAQMSGNAAKEISTMLEASVGKVENIVSNNKNKISSLVSSGREKVEAGTRTAQECGQVLDGILQNVTRVNQLVAEISHASQEQAQGVQEVTKAMSQLDQVTQQNASIAQQSSSAANELNIRSEGLKGLSFDLLNVVGVERSLEHDTDSKQAVEEHTDIPKASVSTAKIRKAVQSAAAVAQKNKQIATTKEPATQSTVLRFPTQNPPATKSAEEPEIAISQASGDSSRIPSADDPRFRDV